MSFITKRERVFNEYSDPFDLPARSEGKLKAYSSCTDARAWSHFVTDKTEHLVEIIKRNTEVCRGKYVPMNVIIEMMLSHKNSEIERLKRKIGTLEKIVSAYDQLDLTPDQRCEINAAHAVIKAAAESLMELPPLDLSGFTDGFESEGFETGKSSGDDGLFTAQSTGRIKSVEWAPDSFQGDRKSNYKKDNLKDAPTRQGGSASTSDLKSYYTCDASTSVHDNRIDELQESLISKDAKLSALQNTIAVMENDVCEPYCIYAHIYTALEKIYATLSQNDKYRVFLSLMSSGKDTRCLDIKGKILFKMKILEKFSLALLSPCAERFKHDDTCECYYAEVSTSVGPLGSTAGSKQPDVKRAQLVADIMANDEISQILDKDIKTSAPGRSAIEPDDVLIADNYSIEAENLTRLKHLQVNYDDLINCYENVKHERDNLKQKCLQYEEMEAELERLKAQMREYSGLYSERDYYRKRSEDLDSLKEQYLILADETTNLETQLKAEAEINSIKSNTIEDLRSDNIDLEKRLNEATIAFEKEKNAILCKLKEAECKIMCQEQQIRSLSAQIDALLGKDQAGLAQERAHFSNFGQDRPLRQEDLLGSVYLMDEINLLKSQIKNLNDALYNSEDEKQRLQEQFEDRLKLINDLKLEIEDWKSTYEKTLQKNDYLENYTETVKDEIQRLVEENRMLSQDENEKTAAVANLISVIHNKSQEINRLNDEIEARKEENYNLLKQLQDLQDKYGQKLEEAENQRKQVGESLRIAKRESQELLNKVKDYDELRNDKEKLARSLAEQSDSCTELKNELMNAIEANQKLQTDLISQENNNSILLQEIQRLRDINKYAADNLDSLKSDKEELRQSYELQKKDSESLRDKMKEFDDLRNKFENLKISHEILMNENKKLENELHEKDKTLDEAMASVELTKKESATLLEKLENSENLKEDMMKLSDEFTKLKQDKVVLQKGIEDKNKELNNLSQTLNQLRTENERLKQNCANADDLEKQLERLMKSYNELLEEKSVLQKDFDIKTHEINNLCNTLDSKIEENRDLAQKIKSLENSQIEANKDLDQLRAINTETQSILNTARKDSERFESLLKDFDDLQRINNEMKLERETLNENLKIQQELVHKLESENSNLQEKSDKILAEFNKLENELKEARQELIDFNSNIPYTDIMKEIEDMKREKSANHNKIRELLQKIDEADILIATLNENVLARNDKIAILENHINSLQNEVRSLQKDLVDSVHTGEDLKDNSDKKLNQTLNKIEAHHSKATHNMKMELAKLQNEKSSLEEQLSIHKIKSDESFRDKHKYISQLIHLQNEREIIVTDIKQIEMSCAGDSKLSPEVCSIEDILKSLDKIRSCLEARLSKSSSLEKTLNKVQTSSQLLISKADEAKRLVEKEKQKIINEKEDAVTEKRKMEEQLSSLRSKLEEQTARDANIIKDLEKEILNQNLIIDKLNQSTKEYISKLEEDLESLQSLYKNALDQIKELQDKIKNLTDENDRNKIIIEKINKDFENKSKEVSNLQNDLDILKSKSNTDASIQAGLSNKMKNTKSQTDKPQNIPEDAKSIASLEEDKIITHISNMMKQNRSHSPPKKSPPPSNNTQAFNEVQILTAKVEPQSVFAQKSYVEFKKNQLSMGKLEQYSILPHTNTDNPPTNALDQTTRDQHFIDLYGKQSDLQTISSNILPQEYANEPSFSGVKYESKQKDNSYNRTSVSSEENKKNDLFLIYHDSESSQSPIDNKSYNEKKGKQDTIIVETAIVQPFKDQHFKNQDSYKQRLNEEEDVFEKGGEARTKLRIEIPRVDTDLSALTVTDTDNSKTLLKAKRRATDRNYKDRKDIFLENSPLRLSRTEINDTRIYDSQAKKTETMKNKSHEDFGLDYILNSVKQEYEVESLRKTQSDRLLSQLPSLDEIDSSFERTFLSNLPSSSRQLDHTPQNKKKEQSVMVNTDPLEYYEHKIQRLSQQLDITEKDYKKKLEAIKIQYDNNIKSIINDHNQGVRSIQSLHEETLQDVLKVHENEVENLRSMSIEAMRRAERLERENRLLVSKMQECKCGCILEVEPIKISSAELNKRRSSRCRGDMRMLTKTNVEAFNVKPKMKPLGPCTCSLDVNVSDTIRNIFEQVDVEQRKLAEHAYLKFIANKILTCSFEALDAHELSFLHLKVCRMWKSKISKEEALQKKIDTLEIQMLTNKGSKQKHIADLDRDLAEQRRRLSEAREAVCRCSPDHTPPLESRTSKSYASGTEAPSSAILHGLNPAFTMHCVPPEVCFDVNERCSAGDVEPNTSDQMFRAQARAKLDTRTALAKLEAEERRKRLCDETPTRLRRTHDRHVRPPKK